MEIQGTWSEANERRNTGRSLDKRQNQTPTTLCSHIDHRLHLIRINPQDQLESKDFIQMATSAVLGVPTWLLVFVALGCASGAPYLGKTLGPFKTYAHGVTGDLFAVDSRTILVKGFSYDGQGPDAFFWAGSTEKTSADGFIVPDEKGTTNVLKSYNNQDVVLTLPDGKTINDIKWFAVWCRSFTANFGDISIPVGFEAPAPQRLDRIVGTAHNTSTGPIIVVDSQTFMVPKFYVDGQAPDAHFWVGKGEKPSPNGILVPDENGSSEPLGRYDGQTVVIELPGDLTVFDIDWFSVWCRQFEVDFGHIKIPKNLNVPPSLKVLGSSPQSKLNCEVLFEGNGLELRWAQAGESVVMQVVVKLGDGEYVSVGLSGNERQTAMVGGDVVVAWLDNSGQGHAVDYFLDAKSQCSGGRGSCPDYRIQPNTNSVRLLNAARIDGYTMITFQRPLAAIDDLDRPITPGVRQPVIWAVGPLNELNEVSYHSIRNTENVFIDFGRSPQWNCPLPLDNADRDRVTGGSSNNPIAGPPAVTAAAPSEEVVVATTFSPRPLPSDVPEIAQQPNPNPLTPAETEEGNVWFIPPVECPEPHDNVFYAQIGPAGGKKGYTAITGHVGWGIAWYINGLLIPEITVVRGKTYTFVVEGGNDIDAPAKNHPFYITDDPVGGFENKKPEERMKVRNFAGVGFDANGDAQPTAAGRLCEWFQKSSDSADDYGSFGEYQRVLELRCDKGRPAVLQWTPDNDTPDLVYYQCYTHRHLGWKIHVVDRCQSSDREFGASFLHVTNTSVNSHPDSASGRSTFLDKRLINATVPGSNPLDEADAFPLRVEYMERFKPLRDDDGNDDFDEPQSVGIQEANDTFVSDPFHGEVSEPFQVGFQPGEPQFGGFGASNFGQRFEKAPPVYIPKNIVPVAPIVPDLPAFQPMDRRREPVALESQHTEQHPVIFRSGATNDDAPPPPPEVLPKPNRPPRPEVIPGANATSEDPVLDLHDVVRPVMDTRPFVPFRGSTPPVQTTATNGSDYSILSDVWSIIDRERKAGASRRRDTREAEKPVMEVEPSHDHQDIALSSVRPEVSNTKLYGDMAGSGALRGTLPLSTMLIALALYKYFC